MYLPGNTVSHYVSIEQDSLLFEILKETSAGVNSFHHQGIKTVGNGLKISAKSKDGVIEAIELGGTAFVLGLQWHPEQMYDSAEQKKIFTAFIERAQ